jgi:hypothetical protein
VFDEITDRRRRVAPWLFPSRSGVKRHRLCVCNASALGDGGAHGVVRNLPPGACGLCLVGRGLISMVWRSFSSEEMLDMQELATWGAQ